MNDLIYITGQPSFYKINLFNRIALHKKLLVIFTHEGSNSRNPDFFKGERKFAYFSIAGKSEIAKILFIVKLLSNEKYQRLLLSGWDQLIICIAAYLSQKKKNCIVIESSIIESKTNGFKGFLKRIYLSQFSVAYVSGKSQSDLIMALKFKGRVIKTKGVGIFNLVPQLKYRAVQSVTKFIYVGRLSSEKNLLYLVETFNTLPDLTLNIIGYGPQESSLKTIARKNIIFHGPVANSNLPQKYYENEVFILPSSSEVWGLVVEEALNCGLPVLVSDKVGCAAELINESNGIIFKLEEKDSLRKAINTIRQVDFYNHLRYNISQMDFNKIADDQVNCYI